MYRYVFVDLPGSAAIGLTQILHLPSTCILVSNSSLASVRDLSRWRDCIGPNSSERQTLHVLNMSGAAAGLTEDEFIRAVGHPPDYIIAFDRNIAMASKFGVKATQKCEVLVRGLGPLLGELAGKLSEKPRSIFSRIFG
jgi:pilus assembly protein CpaE